MDLIKKYYKKTILFLNKYTEKLKNIKEVRKIKKKHIKILSVLIVLFFVATLIFSKEDLQKETAVVEESTQITKLVEEFGRRQALVSLVSEKEERDRSISGHYSYYATSDLIRTWQKDYENAPGRKTADPWPGRIEVDSVEEKKDEYIVFGRLIELTSDSSYKNGIIAEYPVELKLIKVDNKWLISEYNKILKTDLTDKK